MNVSLNKNELLLLVKESLKIKIKKYTIAEQQQMVRFINDILKKYPHISVLFVRNNKTITNNDSTFEEIEGGGYYKGGEPQAEDIISSFSMLFIMLMMVLSMSKSININITENKSLDLNEDDIPLERELEDVDTNIYNISLFFSSTITNMELSNTSFANANNMYGWGSFFIRFAVLISVLYEAYQTNIQKKRCEITTKKDRDNSEIMSEIIILIMGFLSWDIEGLVSGAVDNSSMSMIAGLIIKSSVIYFSNTHLAPMMKIVIQNYKNPKMVANKISKYIKSNNKQQIFGGNIRKKSKKRRKTKRKYRKRRITRKK
jgi:hypothetical protein